MKTIFKATCRILSPLFGVFMSSLLFLGILALALADEPKPIHYGFDPEDSSPIFELTELNKMVSYFDTSGHLVVNGFSTRLANPFYVQYANSHSDRYSCPKEGNVENKGGFDIVFELILQEDGKYGTCQKGMTICYIGGLEPANIAPKMLEDKFQLTNLPDNEVTEACQNPDPEFAKWGKENEKEKRKILHGFSVKVSKIDKKRATDEPEEKSEDAHYHVQIMFSYSSIPVKFAIKETKNALDQRQLYFTLKWGIGDIGAHPGPGMAALFSRFELAKSDAGAKEENDGEPRVRAHVSTGVSANDERKFINGMNVRNTNPLMHLFPDFAMMQHVHLPMIAMIPGGPECQMTATVEGDQIRSCMSHDCNVPLEDVYYGETETSADFEPQYKEMRLVSAANPNLKFNGVETKLDNNSKLIFFRDQEVSFAVTRKASNQAPLRLVFKRPDGDKDCVSRNAEENTMILAINGDPACYVRIAWLERRIKAIDSYDVENEILAASSWFMTIKDEEIHVQEQHDGDGIVLVRFPCTLERRMAQRSMANILTKGQNVWRFILNPKHPATHHKLKMEPKCMLSVGFEPEYSLFVQTKPRERNIVRRSDTDL